MQQPTNPPRINRNAYRQGMEVNKLRKEVSELTNMLESERSHRCLIENQQLLLSQELEETKEKLARQKTLKEMFINRGKETKKELEMLKKYSSEETLSRHRIALKVRDTTRQKKKRELHIDYEELQVAHAVNNEKFNTVLKEGADKIKALQEELQRASASYQELKLQYDNDVQTAKLQIQNLQQELHQQRQTQAERAAQDQQVIMALRAEQDHLQQKMNEEVAAFQQSAFEKEKLYWSEIEELKTQLSNQGVSEDNNTVHKCFTTELQEERNRSKILQEELEQQKVLNQELHQRHDTEIQTLKHQAESQQQQLQTEIKTLNDKTVDNQMEIWSMIAEAQEVKEKTAEEINALKKTSVEKESVYCRELEELRSQCASLLSQNTELTNQLQERREEEAQDMETNSIQMEETEGAYGAEEPAETAGAAAAPPETAKPKPLPSVWKQTRHFLGLRKPQSWKKK